MIFIDMDGVLVDWMGGVSHTLQRPIEEIVRPGQWHVDFDHTRMPVSWWRNLRETSWCTPLLNFARRNGARILTAAHSDQALAGKWWWIKDHAPDMLDKLIFVTGNDKHMLNRDGILIDDSDHNIKDWGPGGFIVPQLWNHGTEDDKLKLIRLIH